MKFDGRIRADARALPLADESVQCVVTSPPYWGLRDYGHAGQIGIEKTPYQYVNAMLSVFDEVWRVLKSDGTLWLNLGDSYAGSWGAGSRGKEYTEFSSLQGGSMLSARINTTLTGSMKNTPGLKPKDLIGIPWKVAFALQAQGWYLRSDIIWAKPNPMPESVTDRPTRSHEYVFLLTKSERYFYNASAIKEPGIYAGPNARSKTPHGQGFSRRAFTDEKVRQDKQHGHGRRHDGFNDRWDAMEKSEQCSVMRNKRDVWAVATSPYSDWQETFHQERVSKDGIGDDTQRTTSPDCPIHAGRPDSPAIPFCDAREVDSLIRSGRNGGGRAPTQAGDFVPTEKIHALDFAVESSDLLARQCLAPAKQRGNQSSKMVHAQSSGQSNTPSVQSIDDIERSEATDESSDSAERTRASSILPADLNAHPSVQILLSSEDRILAACCCEFYRVTTKKSSHYATFPPSLIEPCILAGSRPGDFILDPFAGSGTVAMVAEKHSRRGISIDLGYQDLQAKRMRNLQKVLTPISIQQESL